MADESRRRQPENIIGRLETFAPFGEEVTSTTSLTAFFAIWRRFITMLELVITRLVSNDFVLRRLWQPGDIKLSFRQPDMGMPGFKFADGAELSREEFSSLFRVLGDRGHEDESKFYLPDVRARGMMGMTAPKNNAGALSTVKLTSGGAREQIYVSVWVKT